MKSNKSYLVTATIKVVVLDCLDEYEAKDKATDQIDLARIDLVAEEITNAFHAREASK